MDYIKYCMHDSKPTCHREFLGLAGHRLLINGNGTLIIPDAGQCGLVQWVQQVLCAAGGFGVNDVVVLVYGILATQRHQPRRLDHSMTSQSHIGAPGNFSPGFNEQGDVSYLEY